MKSIYEWLEAKGIVINDRSIMEEALTHSSYLNENKDAGHDNERLEFMGDAVLQLWTTQKIFKIEPHLSEGEMTTLRAQLVCEEALSDYNREFGWGEYLKLGVGEDKMGGRARDSILADMFEAVLGAIYMDQGLEPIDILLEEVVTPAIAQPKKFEVIDFKTKLQEFVQSDTRKNVRYEVLSQKGPSNRPEFEIAVFLDKLMLGVGKGNSKKRAEQMAAKNAIEKMAK